MVTHISEAIRSLNFDESNIEHGRMSVEEYETSARSALEQALRTGALTKTIRYTREQVNAMCSRFDLDPEKDFVLAQDVETAQDGTPSGISLDGLGAGYTLTPHEMELRTEGCKKSSKVLRRIVRYQLHPDFNLR